MREVDWPTFLARLPDVRTKRLIKYAWACDPSVEYLVLFEPLDVDVPRNVMPVVRSVGHGCDCDTATLADCRTIVELRPIRYPTVYCARASWAKGPSA
jgi:hypothetical protein